ncbi:MAG: polysaccharide deacetylase family protein [Acidobacteriota bacterium]
MTANALTVDVEEWFHICGVPGLAQSVWPSLPSRVVDNTTRLLDLLDRCGARGTFFVLGYVAERFPELIARIRDAGHQIGSHGHLHTRVYELGPDGFARDLDRSLRALTGAGTGAIRTFRAPEWSINDRSLWALDVLAARGVTCDSSMAPMRVVGNPRYPHEPHRRETPHGSILEVPPMVGRRFGQNVPLGGGWGLRMARPSTVLREVERRNLRGERAVFWVHPWEVDPSPPHVALPLGLWFAHYFRLSGFASRFEQVLRGARFEPLVPEQEEAIT